MSAVFSDAFHRHLDGCQQCREHPFALCREGEILIRAAALELKRKSSAPKPSR